jgi:hypothetical protein
LLGKPLLTTREVIMDGKEPAYFDLETVALLREVLDDAWALLRPEHRATMLKTRLSSRPIQRNLRINFAKSCGCK